MKATLRFYAELNDFLSKPYRQSDVPYEFAVAPSVKDAIEALGVPHTEVDLILVNSTPVDFGYRLADGDRISVFPVFERLDISDLTRVRPDPLRDFRFVVDGHLGKLSRNLRLLGFDTQWRAECSDDELASISSNERRVLLTSDRGLLKRRAVTYGVYVRRGDPTEQVVDVVRRLHLGEHLHPFTRCMVCNGLLEEADKGLVAHRLAPGTRHAFTRFWRCGDCARIYWQGSHHRHLLDVVARAMSAERPLAVLSREGRVAATTTPGRST